MSTIIRLEEKLVVATQNLLDQVSKDIVLTKNLLDKPAFNVNVVALVQKVIKIYISPAVIKIKKIQQNLEQLRRFNAVREKAHLMQELADDLLIDVVIAKKNLEEIRLRSNAPILVEVVAKKRLIPALHKIDEIKEDLIFLKQIFQMHNSLKSGLKWVGRE